MGVFDYRGVVVPVIDLGVLLGGEACRDRLSTRVIVVDVRHAGVDQHPETETDAAQPPEGTSGQVEPGRESERLPASPRWLIGIVAEQVSDVATVKPEKVISPSMGLPQTPYLGEIVDIGHEMTQLIVVDRLLDQSFLEAFFDAGSDSRETVPRQPDAEAGPS